MAKGFTFKQFHVDDHGCGMPVSTDGVLLGTWAGLPELGEILDIGTGSGLLALIAAQRTGHTSLPVTAVEIDQPAANAARKNFADSPWASRLHCIEHNVQTWAQAQPTGRFNAIVCNPPYFNNGQQADSQARATARHTDSLSHSDLLTVIRHLLSEDGNASLILPEYEGRQLIEQATQHKLFCRRVCEVRSTERKPVTRLLITLSPQSGDTVSEALCIHHQGAYSEAFTTLTSDFYLKL